MTGDGGAAQPLRAVSSLVQTDQKPRSVTSSIKSTRHGVEILATLPLEGTMMKAARRTALPIAIAVGGLVVATACDVNESSYTGAPGGNTIAIIGDDQTAAIQTDLHTALDPSYASRNISLEGKTFAGMQASADTLAATNPQAVIIDVGTNDASTGASSDTMLAGLDTMIAKFPTSCVVVVNLNTQTTTDPSYSTATAGAYNDGLSSRNVYVADWNDDLAAGNLATYTTAPDQLVPTGDGKAALANDISNGVYRCFHHASE
jgi:hypothetical protein